MIKFITEMPEEDSSRERQYTIPFFADMFFNYNHKVVNDVFFTSIADEERKSKEKEKVRKRMATELDTVDVLLAPD